MALEPAVAGARHTGQQITWTRSDGSAEDLTGATITGVLFDRQSGIARAIAGTLNVVNPGTNGVFTWAYAAGDVVAGYYKVQFKATASGTYDLSFEEAWTVYPAR